jgi:hypothetical protein
MNKFFTLLIFSLPVLCCSCDNEEKEQDKKPILLADREAPLGWVYLYVYDDKSFDFVLAGLRDKTDFSGTYRLRGDTIFFTYTDSIPKAGKTAIVSEHSVSFIDGDYPESVVIKLNKLTK